ncbi:hypothetical protein ACIG87_13485 [Micromonospora sp. NPDC051925]|uniref:hypothetical protein n=1 Tax=Micromonospora sp. NPDC051925 TaxID=3364288 RepID=UPI0037C8217E
MPGLVLVPERAAAVTVGPGAATAGQGGDQQDGVAMQGGVAAEGGVAMQDGVAAEGGVGAGPGGDGRYERDDGRERILPAVVGAVQVTA